MFSGGVDSTVAALSLANDYDEIHLLTYENGHGNAHLKRTIKRAAELRKHCAAHIRHSIINIQDIFELIVTRSLENDYKDFQSGFIWCMGCKIAMHTRTIIYNLSQSIAIAADGSSLETDEMVEQMPSSVRSMREFYKNNNIDFIVPNYNQTRDEKRTLLKKLRFKMGIPIRDRYLGIQPTCFPGELYYLPYVLFNQGPIHNEDTVSQYINRKLTLAQTYIDKHAK